MTLRSDLVELETRIHHITTHAINALTRTRDQVDSYDSLPTHVIGASAPTSGPAIVYEGECAERVDLGPDLLGRPVILRCGRDRPCPVHDTRVTLTPVETAGQQLTTALRRHEELTKAIARLLAAAKHAEIEINRNLEKPDTAAKMCTRGLGTDQTTPHEGAKDCRIRTCDGHCTPWADPNCRRPADRASGDLCESCLTRENTWRQAHGLEPVTRIAMCVRDCGRPAAQYRQTCDACRMADTRARNKAS